METQLSAQKNSWKKIVIPATLVAGLTAGAFFSPIGSASAVDAETSEETTVEQASVGSEEKAGERSKRNRAGHKAERAEAIAGVLDISTDDLKAGFESGSTLAELAEQNGVGRDDLVEALTELSEDRVENGLTEGKIDEEKAAKIREGMAEKIEEKIDQTPGEGRSGGHHKGRRGHGMKDSSEGAESPDSE